ncbi:hypothetical protein FNF29_00711 [Cafeteria roenbergensis]|uniref:Peptidase A1 domain-containing protein n=2 Tax=Cafeteria roenbergensis TaxID=33653 RepID=A0A5A8CWS5_CAFRO|nr:hypothetical protein FNF29_00711 [Cafeteria roenbergensis]|eukprot:KAA0156600.1 hypothetical protein FNF29_00711 [Cafeteria roenbergensis]
MAGVTGAWLATFLLLAMAVLAAPADLSALDRAFGEGSSARAELMAAAHRARHEPIEHRQYSDSGSVLLQLRRRQRSHEEVLELANSLKVRSATSPEHAARLAAHADKRPHVSHVAPAAAPLTGGTMITVFGRNLDGGDVYRCAFGTATSPATFHPGTGVVTCVVPPIHTGPAASAGASNASAEAIPVAAWDVSLTVAIVSHHADRLSHTATLPSPFRLYSPALALPRVSRVAPLAGPSVGGTRVFVQGRFSRAVPYDCVFGSRRVPAVLVSEVGGRGRGFMSLRELERAVELHAPAGEQEAGPAGRQPGDGDSSAGGAGAGGAREIYASLVQLAAADGHGRHGGGVATAARDTDGSHHAGVPETDPSGVSARRLHDEQHASLLQAFAAAGPGHGGSGGEHGVVRMATLRELERGGVKGPQAARLAALARMHAPRPAPHSRGLGLDTLVCLSPIHAVPGSVRFRVVPAGWGDSSLVREAVASGGDGADGGEQAGDGVDALSSATASVRRDRAVAALRSKLEGMIPKSALPAALGRATESLEQSLSEDEERSRTRSAAKGTFVSKADARDPTKPVTPRAPVPEALAVLAGTDLSFEFFAPPSAGAPAPPAASAAGDSAVRVPLDVAPPRGAVPMCRFGPATGPGSVVVRGAWDDGFRSVACIVPPSEQLLPAGWRAHPASLPPGLRLVAAAAATPERQARPQQAAAPSLLQRQGASAGQSPPSSDAASDLQDSGSEERLSRAGTAPSVPWAGAGGFVRSGARVSPAPPPPDRTGAGWVRYDRASDGHFGPAGRGWGPLNRDGQLPPLTLADALASAVGGAGGAGGGGEARGRPSPEDTVLGDGAGARPVSDASDVGSLSSLSSGLMGSNLTGPGPRSAQDHDAAALRAALGPDLAAHALDAQARSARPLPSSTELGTDAMMLAGAAMGRLKPVPLPSNTSLHPLTSPEMARLAALRQGLLRASAKLRAPLQTVYAAAKALSETPASELQERDELVSRLCLSTLELVNATCEGGAVAAVLGRDLHGAGHAVEAAHSLGCPESGPMGVEAFFAATGGPDQALLQRGASQAGGAAPPGAGALGTPSGPRSDSGPGSPLSHQQWSAARRPEELPEYGRRSANRPAPGSPCEVARFTCATFGVFLREKMPRCGLQALRPAPAARPARAPLRLGGVIGHPPLEVSVAVSFNGEDWTPASKPLRIHDPSFVNLTALGEGAEAAATTVAFSPTSGPAAGGTPLTISGLPVTLLLAPSDGGNATGTSASARAEGQGEAPQARPRAADVLLLSRTVPLAAGGAVTVGCELGAARLPGRIEWGPPLDAEALESVLASRPAAAGARQPAGDVLTSALTSFLPPTFSIVCVTPPLSTAAGGSRFPVSGAALRPVVGGKVLSDLPFTFQTLPLAAGDACVVADGESEDGAGQGGEASAPRRRVLASTRAPLAATLHAFDSPCPPGSARAQGAAGAGHAAAAIFRFVAPSVLAAGLPASAAVGSPLTLTLAVPASNPPPLDCVVRLRVAGRAVVRMLPVVTHTVLSAGVVTTGQGAAAMPLSRPQLSAAGAAGAFDGSAWVLLRAVGSLPDRLEPGRAALAVSFDGSFFFPLSRQVADPFDPRRGMDPVYPTAGLRPEIPAELLAGPAAWAALSAEAADKLERHMDEGADLLWAQLQPRSGPGAPGVRSIAASSALFIHPHPHAYAVAPTSASPQGGDPMAAAMVLLHASPLAGPAVGGTDVTVFAVGIAGGRDFMCRFGSVAVPAAFRSGWWDDEEADGAGGWDDETADAVGTWRRHAAEEAAERRKALEQLHASASAWGPAAGAALLQHAAAGRERHLGALEVASAAKGGAVSLADRLRAHALKSHTAELGDAAVVGSRHDASAGWVEGMGLTELAALRSGKLNWTLWDLEAERAAQWRAHGESLASMRRSFVGDGSDGDGGVHPAQSLLQRRAEVATARPALDAAVGSGAPFGASVAGGPLRPVVSARDSLVDPRASSALPVDVGDEGGVTTVASASAPLGAGAFASGVPGALRCRFAGLVEVEGVAGAGPDAGAVLCPTPSLSELASAASAAAAAAAAAEASGPLAAGGEALLAASVQTTEAEPKGDAADPSAPLSEREAAAVLAVAGWEGVGLRSLAGAGQAAADAATGALGRGAPVLVVRAALEVSVNSGVDWTAVGGEGDGPAASLPGPRSGAGGSAVYAVPAGDVEAAELCESGAASDPASSLGRACKGAVARASEDGAAATPRFVPETAPMEGGTRMAVWGAAGALRAAARAAGVRIHGDGDKRVGRHREASVWCVFGDLPVPATWTSLAGSAPAGGALAGEQHAQDVAAALGGDAVVSCQVPSLAAAATASLAGGPRFAFDSRGAANASVDRGTRAALEGTAGSSADLAAGGGGRAAELVAEALRRAGPAAGVGAGAASMRVRPDSLFIAEQTPLRLRVGDTVTRALPRFHRAAGQSMDAVLPPVPAGAFLVTASADGQEWQPLRADRWAMGSDRVAGGHPRGAGAGGAPGGAGAAAGGGDQAGSLGPASVMLGFDGESAWRFGCVVAPRGWRTALEARRERARLDRIRAGDGAEARGDTSGGSTNSTSASSSSSSSSSSLESAKALLRLRQLAAGSGTALPRSALRGLGVDVTSLGSLSRSPAFDAALDAAFGGASTLQASLLQTAAAHGSAHATALAHAAMGSLAKSSLGRDGADLAAHAATAQATTSTPEDLPGPALPDAGAVRCYYRGPLASAPLHLSGAKAASLPSALRAALGRGEALGVRVGELRAEVEVPVDAPQQPRSADGTAGGDDAAEPSRPGPGGRLRAGRLALLSVPLRPVKAEGSALWFADLPLSALDATHRRAGAGGSLWFHRVTAAASVVGRKHGEAVADARRLANFRVTDDGAGRGWEVDVWRQPSTFTPDLVRELGGPKAVAAHAVLSARAARSLMRDASLPLVLLPAFAASPSQRHVAGSADRGTFGAVGAVLPASLLQVASASEHLAAGAGTAGRRRLGTPTAAVHDHASYHAGLLAPAARFRDTAGAPDHRLLRRLPAHAAPPSLGLRGGTLFAPLSAEAFATSYARTLAESRRVAGDAAPSPALMRGGGDARRLGRVLVALTLDVPLPPPPQGATAEEAAAAEAESREVVPKDILPSLHVAGGGPPSALAALPPGGPTTGAGLAHLPGSAAAQPRANVRPVGAHAAVYGGRAVPDRVAWGGQAAPVSWYAAGVETMSVVVRASWGGDDLGGAVPGSTMPAPEEDFLAEEDGGPGGAVTFVAPDLSATMLVAAEAPGRPQRSFPLSRVSVAVGLQALVAPLHAGQGADDASPAARSAGTLGGAGATSRGSAPPSEDLSAPERSVLAAAPVAWSPETAGGFDIDVRVTPDRGSTLSPLVRRRGPEGKQPGVPGTIRLEAPVLMALRLDPRSMADTPVPFPLALGARPAFDASVASDVEGATGVPAHRLTVLSASASSGVVVVRCVGSLDPTEPSCGSAKDALQAAVADTGSALHDGVVGFNADPLFNKGGHGEVTSKGVVVAGTCSNPALLTRRECESVGECSCDDVRRDDPAACERSVSMSGQPCLFSAEHTWTPGARRVKFAGCTDPRFKSKAACLAAGKCSDPKLRSREACLAPGVCLPPKDKRGPGMNTVGRPVMDFTQFRTRQECIDPKARSEGGGRCTTSPGSNDPVYPCFRHREKQPCESPPHRPKLPGEHACVRPPGGVPFDYTQFTTRAQCEQPALRDCAAVARRHKVLFGDTAFQGASRPFFLQTGATAAGLPPVGAISGARAEDLLSPPPPPMQPSFGFPAEREPASREAVGAALEALGKLRPGEADGNGLTSAVRSKLAKGSAGAAPDSTGLEGVDTEPGQPEGTGSDGAAASDGADNGQGGSGKAAKGSAQEGAGLPARPGASRPASDSASAVVQGSDCGPKGIWAPTSSLLAKGPVCVWRPEEKTPPCKFGQPPPCIRDIDSDEMDRQKDEDPGDWVTPNNFDSTNDWKEDGTTTEEPCPCEWPANKYHLKKCNWWKCGPGSQSASADGQIDYYRQKQPNEMVSDYNAMVSVGGSKLWMTIDTSTSTTWVMSMACFTVGCSKVKIYAGAFIPALPPGPFPIDLLEAGLFQILSMVGINGHTMVNAGASVMGAPFMFGILDLGTINPMAFNHSGTVGLAYWEDNWPWQMVIMDPMLSVLDFQRCGNTFYPIPMVPVPIPKTFQLWAIPPAFPGGVTLKVAFFFGDTGGCYFVNGVPGQFARAGMKRLMIMPTPGIKFLTPSWMFMITGLKIGGASLSPCLIPALCRGVFTTGSFSTSGPLIPVLTMLEAVAAPLTCEHLEILPSITFNIMGSGFKLERQDYTILGFSFDSVQCMTAFTPMAQLIPGMDLWRLGDSFVRAYYLQIDIQPMRSAKLGLADQPFYEKNGCSGTGGVGPVAKYKKKTSETAGKKGSDATASATKERGSSKANMFWKRRQNWEDDLKGMKDNLKPKDEDDCSASPAGGARFRSLGGKCVPRKHHPEMGSLRDRQSSISGMIEAHREKIDGWKEGRYHGANGEEDADAWLDEEGDEEEEGEAHGDAGVGGPWDDAEELAKARERADEALHRTAGGAWHGIGRDSSAVPSQEGVAPSADVNLASSYSAQFFGEQERGGAGALLQEQGTARDGQGRRLRGHRRGRTAAGVLAPTQDEAAPAGLSGDSAFHGRGVEQPTGVDLSRPLPARSLDADAGADGATALPLVSHAELLDAVRSPTERERRSAEAVHRALHGAFDVDGFLGGLVARDNEVQSAQEEEDAEEARLGRSGEQWSVGAEEGRLVGRLPPLDQLQWPNVSALSRGTLLAMYRRDDPVPRAQGATAAAAARNNSFALPSAVESRLDGLSSGMWTLPDELRAWLLARTPATAPHLHADVDRAAGLSSEAAGRASDFMRVHTAVAFVESQAMQERRRRERLRLGVEPEESTMPPLPRRQKRRGGRRSGAWAPHADPYYRALGYGKASCAHKHPDFDPASRPSSRHGLAYTRGGDMIGCTRDGDPVVLPVLMQETSNAAEEAALIRNMSAVMKHLEAAMNVSDASSRLYWRGESEGFVLRETRRWLLRYRRQIEQAQETAAAHTLLSRQHKEALRAYAMRETTDPAQLLSSIRTALARMGDGSVVDIAAPADAHGGDAAVAMAAMMQDGFAGDKRLKSRGSSDGGDWRERQRGSVESDWDALEGVRHRAAPPGSLRASGGGVYPFVDTPDIKDMEEAAAREAAEEAAAAAQESNLDTAGEALKLLDTLVTTAARQRSERASRGAEDARGSAMAAKLVRGDDGQWRLESNPDARAPSSDAAGEGPGASLLQRIGRDRYRSLSTQDEGSLVRVAALEALEMLHAMHAEALSEHVESLRRQLRAAEADLAREEAAEAERARLA